MQFSPVRDDPLYDALKPVVSGLGMVLLELSVSKHRSSVQVRVTVYKAGTVGIRDCSKVHRAIVPRLDLAFPDQELSVEVMSPGIDRNIKDASEFINYIGRGVRCYRTDVSDWVSGIVSGADTERLLLETKEGILELKYGIIAKAKLDYSQEVKN